MEENVVSQETVQPVSNEEQTQVTSNPSPEQKGVKVKEFKLPTTKEEYDTLVKSAVNREKTNFLKELGVKSVKEYKEQLSKAEEALSKNEDLIKQSEELIKQKEELSQQYESLKQTSTLDRFGVKEEYRDYLIKLAKDKIDAEHSFESVLQNLVETKYQHTIQKGNIKIGSEKTQIQKDSTSVSPELISKYPWLK
mgnify:CR=1 FL=1